MYHHITSPTEMFEFNFSLDSGKRNCWEITFFGHVVTNSGGGTWSKDYDDLFEEGCIAINEDTKTGVFNASYKGAIDIISTMIKYMSYANIEESTKKSWKDTIDEGIEHLKKDCEQQHTEYKL